MNLEPLQRKIYSQFGEDGVTLELVKRLSPTRFFLEIGAGDGSENNTRVLAEMGWGGIWIDADKANAEKMPPVASTVHQKVTVENCGWMRNLGEIGVLSIDIDGNDYWIWKALCEGQHALQPAIVIIEAQIQRPHDVPYIMPYDPDFAWTHDNNDPGASIRSLVELGRDMGYAYIGKCPDYHSPNLFFCRSDKASFLEG